MTDPAMTVNPPVDRTEYFEPGFTDIYWLANRFHRAQKRLASISISTDPEIARQIRSESTDVLHDLNNTVQQMQSIKSADPIVQLAYRVEMCHWRRQSEVLTAALEVSLGHTYRVDRLSNANGFPPALIEIKHVPRAQGYKSQGESNG